MKTLFMRRNYSPDTELIDQLLSSNTTAFEELYDRYWFSLYSYARSKHASADEAKIIVRNIFVQLWQQRFTLSANFSLPSYLYTEVRRATVACLNEKLTTNNESFVATTVLPGFGMQQLQKARQPVQTMLATTPGKKPAVQYVNNYKKSAESWLEKMHGLAFVKQLRHSLFAILHF